MDSKQIIGGLMAILIGLAAYTMKTVNELQLEVKGMMIGHATTQDIQELKLTVQRLQWLLQDDGMEK